MCGVYGIVGSDGIRSSFAEDDLETIIDVLTSGGLNGANVLGGQHARWSITKARLSERLPRRSQAR